MPAKRVWSTPQELTTMVNSWPEPPTRGKKLSRDELKIANGPVFKLPEIQTRFGVKTIWLATDKCNSDVTNVLNWVIADVWNAIQSLKSTDYTGSEFCMNDTGFYLAADAYKIYPWPLDSGREIDLYIKFGVALNGQLLAVISCHD